MPCKTTLCGTTIFSKRWCFWTHPRCRPPRRAFSCVRRAGLWTTTTPRPLPIGWSDCPKARPDGRLHCACAFGWRVCKVKIAWLWRRCVCSSSTGRCRPRQAPVFRRLWRWKFCSPGKIPSKSKAPGIHWRRRSAICRMWPLAWRATGCPRAETVPAHAAGSCRYGSACIKTRKRSPVCNAADWCALWRAAWLRRWSRPSWPGWHASSKPNWQRRGILCCNTLPVSCACA